MMGRIFKCLGMFVLLTYVIPGFSQELQHFGYKNNTGNNATVVIPTSAVPSINNIPLEAGDEIGAFTQGKLCIGAVVWGNGNAILTIWGDDPTTLTVDGLQVGEQIDYRVWSHHENREYQTAEVSYKLDASGNGTYVVNGLYEIQFLNAISPLQPPKLLYPQNEDTLFTAGALKLRWSPASQAEFYQLDVSTDSTFSLMPVYEEISGDTTFSISDLDSGATYYWKVRSISQTDTSRWSGVWSFNIELSAPRLGTLPPVIFYEDRDTTFSFAYLDKYVNAPNTMLSNLRWSFSTDTAITIIQDENVFTILPKRNWNGKTTVLVSVSDGTSTDSTRWQITVLPVNDAPGLFNLRTPENGSNLTITSKNIRDSVVLAWEAPMDPETDSLSYFLEDSPSLLPYLDPEPIDSTLIVLPLLDIFYHLRLTKNRRLSWHWNVGVTDGVDTTYSSNGPFVLDIQNDYIDTTHAMLQAGLIQNQSNSDSTALFLRSSEPLASNPIMILDSETLKVVNENPEVMEHFRSVLALTRDGDYNILIRVQDLSLNETSLEYRFTRHVLTADSGYTVMLPGQSVGAKFQKGSVEDSGKVYLSPMKIYDLAKLADLYPGIENKPQGGAPISIFQIEGINRIVKPFTIYTTQKSRPGESLGFYRLTTAGWDGLPTYTDEETGKIWSTANKADIYALFDVANTQSSNPAGLLFLESYPNPFRGNTTILYSIPVTQAMSQKTVILKIYSIQGRTVKTLVNQSQAPGNYSVTWNGTDERRSRVSSGVYICMLKVGNQRKSHKMTFLK